MSADSTPSLRVLPWHLPYNCGKSKTKTSVRVKETPLSMPNQMYLFVSSVPQNKQMLFLYAPLIGWLL